MTVKKLKINIIQKYQKKIYDLKKQERFSSFLLRCQEYKMYFQCCCISSSDDIMPTVPHAYRKSNQYTLAHGEHLMQKYVEQFLNLQQTIFLSLMPTLKRNLCLFGWGFFSFTLKSAYRSMVHRTISLARTVLSISRFTSKAAKR